MTSEVSSQIVAGDSDRLRRGIAAGQGAPAVTSILSTVALAGIAVTLVVFAALHLLPPTRDISPIRRTISEYALTSSAWAFNLGVIALAASSVAVVAGLVIAGRIRAMSAATVFSAIWVLGLLTLVGFTKHNWALGGHSSSGQVHRMASLFAFLALPVAAMLVGRAGHGGHRSAAARLSFWLGALSLVWFSPILVAIVDSPGAWWQVIPLGLIERGMALTEVLAVVAMALLLRAGGGAEAGTALAPGGSVSPG